MKITYSKSEPFKSGWRGWSDYVDVFVDGKQIGQLVAFNCDHRKYMQYDFSDKLGQMDNDPRSGINVQVSEFGLRAAKTKLESALIKWFENKVGQNV